MKNLGALLLIAGATTIVVKTILDAKKIEKQIDALGERIKEDSKHLDELRNKLGI